MQKKCLRMFEKVKRSHLFIKFNFGSLFIYETMLDLRGKKLTMSVNKAVCKLYAKIAK